MTNAEFLDKVKQNSPTLQPLEVYVKSALHILTRCTVCGHEWNVRASHLSMGDIRCPNCSKKKRAKSQDTFKSQVTKKNPNLEILSDYVNSSTKVKVHCKLCGMTNEVLAMNLIKQGGCKKCAGKIKRTTLEIIDDFNKVHHNVYDYSKVNYVDLKSPVEIICKVHGSFFQRPDSHLSGCGCKKCFLEKETDTAQDFIKKSILLHGDIYDYSNVNYINSHTPVEIICKKHGSFFQKPGNHLNGKNGCPVCRESLGERLLEKYFQENEISFVRQKVFNDLYDKSKRNKLKYDFFLEDYNLLIEFNGRQHYYFNKLWHQSVHDFHRAVHRDWLKRKYAKNNNFNYIVIKYTDIDNINYILEKILHI